MEMVKVIDMHCDTISELYYNHRDGGDMSVSDSDLHVSLEKMEKGGYGLQNFALFTHLDRAGDRPFEYCMKLADTFFTEMKAHQEKISIVKNYREIEENWKAGRMSALLTVEEGGVCQGDPAFLRILFELGARMMTLTWNFPNELGWPNKREERAPGEMAFVPDKEHGLTETGIFFLEEMERLGMIVDISHLNDRGIQDVFDHTTKPFVASHSNCRALAAHPRNLTDEMLRKLSDRGGVAGINFCSVFLRDEVSGREEMSTIQDMIRHMKHMKQVGGIQVIGLGSDFDGIENPVEISDASKMQLLAQGMEKEGFTIGEIEAVFHGNVLRVYREIL